MGCICRGTAEALEWVENSDFDATSDGATSRAWLRERDLSRVRDFDRALDERSSGLRDILSQIKRINNAQYRDVTDFGVKNVCDKVFMHSKPTRLGK